MAAITTSSIVAALSLLITFDCVSSQYLGYSNFRGNAVAPRTMVDALAALYSNCETNYGESVMIERCNGKLRMNVKTFSDLDISYRACTNNFTKYSNIFNYNYQGCNFEKSLRECDQCVMSDDCCQGKCIRNYCTPPNLRYRTCKPESSRCRTHRECCAALNDEGYCANVEDGKRCVRSSYDAELVL